MPASLAGLWITIAVFIPGYVYYAIRRQLVPTRRLSRAMELAGLVVVAAAANAATLMLYFALRSFPLIRGALTKSFRRPPRPDAHPCE